MQAKLPAEADRLEREDQRNCEARGLAKRRAPSLYALEAFFSSNPLPPPFFQTKANRFPLSLCLFLSLSIAVDMHILYVYIYL